jgi:hypothetical protein
MFFVLILAIMLELKDILYVKLKLNYRSLQLSFFNNFSFILFLQSILLLEQKNFS